MVDMVEYYTRHPADACMEICIGGLLSNFGVTFIIKNDACDKMDNNKIFRI